MFTKRDWWHITVLLIVFLVVAISTDLAEAQQYQPTPYDRIASDVEAFVLEDVY